ncbi:MAG: ABC transporter permease subunit [Parcubacteria group bacterium]|nr:ABC transporter permease subunit [Parcubacteria group bacterium]
MQSGRYLKKIKGVVFPPDSPSPYKDAVRKSVFRNFHCLEALAFILLIVVWEVFSRSGLIMTTFFPPPSKIAQEMRTLVFEPEERFLWHLSGTLKRVIFGLGIGFLPGVIFGAIAGVFRGAEKFLGRMVKVFYSIPRVAYLPLFMLTFGLEDNMRYIYIGFGVFFPFFFWTFSAVRNFDRSIIDAAKIDGMNTAQIVLYVVLPVKAAEFLLGVEQGLFFAWGGAFISELQGTARGLGFLSFQAENFWNVERSYAILFLVACFALITLKIPEWLSRLAAERWPQSSD